MENSNNIAISKRKRPRPYVKKACQYCHNSHLSCSHERPCTRCTSRGIECLEQPDKPKKSRRIAKSNNHASAADEEASSPPIHEPTPSPPTATSSFSRHNNQQVEQILPAALPTHHQQPFLNAEEPEESLKMHLLQIIVNNAASLAQSSPSSSPPVCPPQQQQLSLSTPSPSLLSTPPASSSISSSSDYHHLHHHSLLPSSIVPSPTSFLQELLLPSSDQFSLSILPYNFEQQENKSNYPTPPTHHTTITTSTTNSNTTNNSNSHNNNTPESESIRLELPPYYFRFLDFTSSQMSAWSRKTFQNLYANPSLLKHFKLSPSDLKHMNFFDVESKRKHKHSMAPLIKTMYYSIIDPNESGKEPVIKRFSVKMFISNGITRKIIIINFLVEKDFFLYERSKHHIGKMDIQPPGDQKDVFVKELQVNDHAIHRCAYRNDEKAIRTSLLQAIAHVETQRAKSLELSTSEAVDFGSFLRT